MNKRSKPRRKIPRMSSLDQINLDTAGIDIGSSEIFVCVPHDRDKMNVRGFETFTCELYRIADWLKASHIRSVAMESTGIYWIPLYEILEERGFDVCLVNARDVKNVPGRKTDVLDCQWLQQLHTYGLLKASFRPVDEVCELRSLIRHRENLIRSRASHIQRNL